MMEQVLTWDVTFEEQLYTSFWHLVTRDFAHMSSNISAAFGHPNMGIESS
jgi:hypothetical protein